MRNETDALAFCMAEYEIVELKLYRVWSVESKHAFLFMLHNNNL